MSSHDSSPVGITNTRAALSEFRSQTIRIHEKGHAPSWGTVTQTSGCSRWSSSTLGQRENAASPRERTQVTTPPNGCPASSSRVGDFAAGAYNDFR